jgi:hypothetical protein
MKKVIFVSIIILGVILGTVFHEIYHYIMALINNANPSIVISDYGIGIQSSYHSSEIVAYTISMITLIIFVIIALNYLRDK